MSCGLLSGTAFKPNQWNQPVSVYNESDRFDLDYEADVVEQVTPEGAVLWTKEYEVVSKADATVFRLVSSNAASCEGHPHHA